MVICINCSRLLPLKYLERILYYQDGKLSNELVCPACKNKANEVFVNKIKRSDITKRKEVGNNETR